MQRSPMFPLGEGFAVRNENMRKVHIPQQSKKIQLHFLHLKFSFWSVLLSINFLLSAS